MATVQDVARELGLTSQEVIARLRAMGRRVEGHLSTVDDAAAERLRRDNDVPPPANGGPGSSKNEGPAATVARPPSPASSEDSEPEESAAEEPGEKASSQRRSAAARVLELPMLIALALGIAILLKLFLVQAFFIPSVSMVPTLRRGDRVLVEKVGYRFSDPSPGDVVVFERTGTGPAADLPWYDDARNFVRELVGLPSGGTTDYIKRIVAVGGDVIRYSGKPRALVVNGREVSEGYVRGVDRFSPTITPERCKSMEMKPEEGGCRVPAGTVFVMGDNRGDSQDSRFIGPVERDKIVGRAFVIIWPPGNLSGL